MAVIRVEGLVTKFTPVIANGTAVSTAIRTAGLTLTAIALPAAWTAADLTFQASFDDGTTWLSLWDDANAEVKVASATMTARVGDAIVSAGILSKLAAVPMFRLQSGVKGALVNQGADRSFIVYATA